MIQASFPYSLRFKLYSLITPAIRTTSFLQLEVKTIMSEGRNEEAKDLTMGLEEVAYLSLQNHVKIFDADYEPYNGHQDIPGQLFLDLSS